MSLKRNTRRRDDIPEDEGDEGGGHSEVWVICNMRLYSPCLLVSAGCGRRIAKPTNYREPP